MSTYTYSIQKLRLYKVAVLTIVVGPMVGLVVAMVLLWNRYVFWHDIALMLGLYLLTGLGVTIGYHRMLTHKSFETNRFFRGLMLILGTMAFEGAPMVWAATHIHHHAASDEEGDPHSPLEGFWHAHMGWIFRDSFEDPKVYASHLCNDPVVLFVDRYSAVWAALSLLLPFVGGWTGFIWGGLVRIFITHHFTWSVNSICHTFGKRDFETTDESRNNWIIGIFAYGEGWHNNHHAFPESAFHGLRWWQFDLSGLLIRLFEKVGLVWDVQRVSNEAMEAQRVRALKSQEGLRTLRTQLTESIAAAHSAIASLPKEMNAMRLKRLEEIQFNMVKAQHLRKEKLRAYMKEVEELKRAASQRLAAT